MATVRKSDRVFVWASLAAIQGAACWAAYAVLEFLFSSLFYALTRRYASFPAWHWELSALLMAAYLAAGALAGAAAGFAVCALRRRELVRSGHAAAAVDHAATLALVIAFAVSVLLNPLSPRGKYVLFGAAAAFVPVLLAAILSPAWSRRFGFLTNAWVVTAILLGIGQEFALTELQDRLARCGGIGLWAALLGAALLGLAVGAVLIGRRVQSRFAGRRRLTMTAPSWVALALASLVLLASGALARGSVVRVEASAAVGGASGRPNVLMIVLDTVRADHLSVYGYARKTTPNLERLAADSVLYANAIAPSDMTLTSHASLFTGAYAGWHGAYCNPPGAVYGGSISDRLRTLAEILSAKGYATYGVSANVYLREEFGAQRGFDSFRIPRPVPVLASENWFLLRVGMRRALSRFVDTAQFDRLFARGEDVNQELFSMLGSHPPRGKPFFVFLNYMDAHYPYVPPVPFDRTFPGKQNRITQDDMDRNSEAVVHGQPMPDTDRAHRISQYDAGIAYDDHQIGGVLDWLERRGLYDNTLVVVASDHGEAFGEKNLVLHGNSAYQDLLHVALMIKFPRSARRGVVRDPVSLVDVFPTVMSTLGYPVPREVQGQDLLAASRGRELFSDELYDLSADPSETHNLHKRDPQSAETLAARLSAWLKTAPEGTARKSAVDADSVNRLKSLGYVQ